MIDDAARARARAMADPNNPMRFNNRQNTGYNPGYVYLLRAGPFYKIGHSRCVAGRAGDVLGPGCVVPPEARQYPAEVVHSITCDEMVTTERCLHWLFRRQRTVGEWFDLSPADIEWICQQTEQSIQEEHALMWKATREKPLDAQPGDLLVRAPREAPH